MNLLDLKKLWKSEVNKLIKEHGKPKIYIFLSMNWDTFKERIFKRGRKIEIDTFDQNENFYKIHITEYEKFTINILKSFGINYRKIDTNNLSSIEVQKKVTEILKKGIYE